MQKVVALDELKNSFSFVSDICPDQLDVLVQHCLAEELVAGTVLDTNFGECKGVILIASGQIKISKLSEDGREITRSPIVESCHCFRSLII